MAERLVIVDTQDEGVVRLSLNRPGRRNALTVPMLDELVEGIAQAGAARDTRVLVLTGCGDAFCSGMDLVEAADVGSAIATGRRLREAMRALGNSPLPSVAVVRGCAVAGGAGLVLACDFALASEEATFGFPELRRGIVPAMAGALAVLRLGDRAARELMLGGELIPAGRAREFGAFTEVVSAGGLDAALAALVGRLRATAPQAAASAKSWLSRIHRATLEPLMEEALDIFTRSMSTSEAADGLAAFRERRQPAWHPANSRVEARNAP